MPEIPDEVCNCGNPLNSEERLVNADEGIYENKIVCNDCGRDFQGYSEGAPDVPGALENFRIKHA